MTDQDHSYREGDEPENAADPAPAPEEAKEPHPSPEGENATSPKGEIPVTAFLVLAYPDGRIEAGVNLAEIPMARRATMRDIRDYSAGLAKEVELSLLSQAVAGQVTKAIATGVKQAQERQLRSQVVGPTGQLRPMRGRGA